MNNDDVFLIAKVRTDGGYEIYLDARKVECMLKKSFNTNRDSRCVEQQRVRRSIMQAHFNTPIPLQWNSDYAIVEIGRTGRR